MICRTCGKKKAHPERNGECYRCSIAGVGFKFVGGGGYTRQSFHDYTIAEKRAEILGDKVVGVDVVPASDFGR